jgi:hypothetical protein
MENENIKIEIKPESGTAEIVIRKGEAEKLIDPKPPVKINISGILNSPLEFLTKRLESGQFDILFCQLLVNREKLTLNLIINENDDYQKGYITGKLEFNSKYKEFGINTGKIWTPTELGLFIKMNRSFFADKSVAMKLTTELMNFKATVDNTIERAVKESGSRTDNFSQVVNSNLPPSFKIQIPIFKGYPAEELEVETFAQIDGREVSFILMSPGANESLENIRDTAIDTVLDEIKTLAPSLVIIEE